MTLARTKPMSAPRRKKCRVCREWFQPETTLQIACSPRCALPAGRELRVTERKRRDRKTREALKTRSDVMKEAQRAFNWFIRERDYFEPCISSGVAGLDEPLTGGSWDCGHYRSIGANPELRFCELNAHKQTKHDNRQLSGNVVNYRTGLRQRIGDEKLEWLEGVHEPQKWTKADLIEIRDEYRRRARQLKRERENGNAVPS